MPTTSPPVAPSTGKALLIGIIVGAISVVIIVAAVVIAIYVYRKKRREVNIVRPFEFNDEVGFDTKSVQMKKVRTEIIYGVDEGDISTEDQIELDFGTNKN